MPRGRAAELNGVRGADQTPRRLEHAVFGLFGLWVVVLAFGCDEPPRAPEAPQNRGSAATAKGQVTVLPRQGHIRQYPCSRCHDKIARSDIEEATDGGVTLAGRHHAIEPAHFDAAGRCTLCHSPGDMDQLRRLDGRSLSFDRSFALCGQCHGEKLRDFEIGAHGKVVGSWSGRRQRTNCTGCHDPHRPAIAQVTALPPPPFPALGIRKEAHE